MPDETSGRQEQRRQGRTVIPIAAGFLLAAILPLAAALSGYGAVAVLPAAGCAALIFAFSLRGLIHLADRYRSESALRRNTAAMLDGEPDALFLEDAGNGDKVANGAMRSLLSSMNGGGRDIPLGEAFGAWLASLGQVPETLFASLRNGSDQTGVQAWVVGNSAGGASAPEYEISVRPLETAGRLWRVHRLGGGDVDGAVSWSERSERHALASATGHYSLNEDGRIVYVNPTMAEWMGRDREEILGGGLSVHDVFAPDSPDDPTQPGIGMLSIMRPDGTRRDIQTVNAVVNGGKGLQVHGTARRIGPAGSYAQRFQRLFQEIQVGVALLDVRLNIGDCNVAFRELVADKDAQGRPFMEYVADGERDAVSRELQSLLDGRSSASSFEVAFKGSGEGVASIFAGQLADDEHRVAGLVLLAIDVTEQKNLEAQLAQSQKMDAVGQLAGGIAHDFNNVLTAMIGFCDLLLQRHRPGDQSFADIMLIKQNANRAAALVRQLLAFSRQQTLQPRLLNVTEVLAELSNLLRRLLGENIELNMMHGRDLGLVKSDQAQLETTIINLAVNARDAMHGGGRLTIETSNVRSDKPRQAHGEMMPPGDYVQISVRDTGTGIPPENFARIFEPFFTTKEVGAGTGLGLATVYGIVKQSGGYLFVDSPGKGKGAVFDIYVRRQHADTAAADRGVPDEIAADLTGGGTVLLVEDEDPVRLFSARALRNKGYKVIEAKTGEAALELLPGGEFDLLVTDMVMPRVDGSQVIREARKQIPDLPVICISGYTEESVLKEVESLDNLRFLSKPFSLKQLAGAVKESIGAGERRRVAAGE